MNPHILVATTAALAAFAPFRSLASEPTIDLGPVELPSPLKGRNLPPTLEEFSEQTAHWSFMPNRPAMTAYQTPPALIESRKSEYRMPVVKPARHEDDGMAKIITDEEAKMFRMPIVRGDEKTEK